MPDEKTRAGQLRRAWLVDALGVLGLVLIVAALWDAWRPLGLAALGGWMVAVGYMAAQSIKQAKKEKTTENTEEESQ